jgi:hypothetical protein
VADVSQNRRRFVIVGKDQAALGTGVVVNLFANLSTEAPPGTYSFIFGNVMLTDGAGQVIFTPQFPGTITIQGTAQNRKRLLEDGVLNAASLLPGAVAPGEIVTLIGSGIGTGGAVAAAFNSVSMPLLYVSANQIHASIPGVVLAIR